MGVPPVMCGNYGILQNQTLTGYFAERRRVFVARSRHKNCVERNRGASPYGILIQPGAHGKHFRGGGGGCPARLGGGKGSEGCWVELGASAQTWPQHPRSPSLLVTGEVADVGTRYHRRL